MNLIRRPLPAAAISVAFAIAACGTPAGTGGLGTQAPVSSAPGSTGAAGATAGPGSKIESLGTALLVPVFGASVPTPTCTDMSGGGRQCRWIAGDGDLLVDADVQTEFETEAEWREAFGTAGFDEELPDIGVAALGGDNPLADGWRASAYTSQGLAFTVTVNKPGAEAEAKAIVTAILKALAT